MASYTASLKLVQPTTGEYPGTWGSQVNTGLTALVDTAIAGTTAITMTAANYTLTSNNGASDEARAMFLVLGGTPGASFNVICPAVSKLYFVVNNTGFAQTIKTLTSSGFSVPNGARLAVYYNPGLTPSPDFVEALNYTSISNTFTAAQTFRTANAIRSEAAATQDAVVIAGRAGGTSSYAVTLTPTTLTANRTLTLPNATDTVAVLGTAQTFTATQTFSGSSSTLAAVLTDAAEVLTISATAATGTINYDVTTQSVLYYTTSASANWTVNFRASSGTSLNTAMSTGQSVTVAFLVTQGATAYYNSAVQVDGASVTPKWQGGSAPTVGNVSGIDVYSYTIIKTGAAAFTVLAAQTRFA
jgi:hypothetical protein